MLKRVSNSEKYDNSQASSADFLYNYTDADGSPKYKTQLEQILQRSRALLEIDLDELNDYFAARQDGDGLVAKIESNTRRYKAIFAAAADSLMQDSTLYPPEDYKNVPEDKYDRTRLRRESQLAERWEQQQGPEQAVQDPQHGLPAELLRRYDVVFKPRSDAKPIRLRDVASRHIGQLVTVQGIVTHMTDVKPLISVAAYVDANTGCEVYQVISGRTFTPLDKPPAQVQARGGAKQPMKLMTQGCKFIKFQEVKIQELTTETPQGGTPKSLTVHLKGALTRTCKPGDLLQISAVYLPQPMQDFRARLKAGLLTDTYLEAMSVRQLKQSYEAHETDLTLQNRIQEVFQGRDVYDRLSSSLAPEIFGHGDVKKALLLLMVSGVTREMSDGLKQRGDIHICLMGDPGVAKSQLIKHITRIAPRAVYTTGKGSSGVGLTASVQKDLATGEMTLEGGALVLADKGICCIDEFDKMEETDRTNIHEVMEQQKVSIAKAGISTSLNTRTTILAAANPAWGRYDTRRSPAENINLPAALLSRFDLMWLILDKPVKEADHKLAKHVMVVHREGHAPREEGNEPLPPELLRGYIAHAKTFAPFVPKHLAEFIATVYADMREEEKANKMPHSYTTARTLQSILRLSQALARLRFSKTVSKEDIDEALRLMRESKASLLTDPTEAGGENVLTKIYQELFTDSRAKNKDTYVWSELVGLLGIKYTHEQIREALEEFGEYNCLAVTYPAEAQPTATLIG